MFHAPRAGGVMRSRQVVSFPVHYNGGKWKYIFGRRCMNEINLRPLSLGELLDKAIRIYRTRFFFFLGISALLEMPSALVNTIASLGADRPSNPDFFIAPFFTAVAFMVLTPLMAQTYLRQPNPIQPNGFKYPAILLSVTIITFLMSSSGYFISSQFRNAVVPSDDISIMPFYFLCVHYLSTIFYVILVARWRMARIISILESQSILSAMRRSWALTQGWFWRIFFIFCALAVLSSIISQALSSIVIFIISLVSSQPPTYQAFMLAQTIVPALIGMLALPLYVSIDLAIYYDLRVRKEGFDLLLRSDSIN